MHLDSPLRSLALKDERLQAKVLTASRTALQRMVQFAIDEDVCAILIAGDLYDGNERSAKTAAFLVQEMDRLRDASIAVYYIKGNHDAENPVTGEIALPSNVHVFDGRGSKNLLPGTDVWIHGVSFRGKHSAESLLPKFEPPVAGAINIGMLHTSLTGAAGHDPYAPCAVSDLQAAGFDYWALGHVHKRQVHSTAPWIVMPGIPQGRDIGEAGPKSATLLKIDGAKIDIEDVPISAVEFRQSFCDTTGVSEDEELRSLLRAHISQEAVSTQSDTAILRVTLSGATPLAWAILRDRDVWEQTLMDLAEDTGVLWIEQVNFDVMPSTTSEVSTDAVAELGVLMDEILHDDGFQAAAKAEIEQMVALLPADRRRDVLPDATSLAPLIKSLAEDGALLMLAQMKGVSK